MASLDFNAANVEQEQEFTLIPAGEYTAAIDSSEMKSTVSGTGQYLSLKVQIIDGVHKGRTLFDNLNLVNPSEKAVQISQARLSSICHAIDTLNISDSSELHNQPLKIKVGIEKRKDTGEDSNRIKKYSSLNASDPKSFTEKPESGSAPAKQPWMK